MLAALDSASAPLLSSSFQIQTHHFSMRPLSFSPTSFRTFAALALSFRRTPFKIPSPHPPPPPLLRFPPASLLGKTQFLLFAASSQSLSASPVVEHLEANREAVELRPSDPSLSVDGAVKDLKSLPSVSLEVKELQDVPEQWKRARLAWLCKELSAHKPATVVRILNGQRKWMRQEDATYVVVHCMRIRENEASFRVGYFEVFLPALNMRFVLFICLFLILRAALSSKAMRLEKW
ncbi:Pentatricopeptide repeat-containing protein [Asimina triloba]